MKSRELAQQNAEFQSFAKDMEQAAKAMGEAVEKLKSRDWKTSIQPEQKALQHLLRAEATRRKIQVAFGNRGGGGGGGGAGRDLESLFDLELDTEKNQYETGAQAASADRASEGDWMKRCRSWSSLPGVSRSSRSNSVINNKARSSDGSRKCSAVKRKS